MNVELTPEGLRKLKEDERFKLWWRLTQVLSKEDLWRMNSELGHVFCPPEKIKWVNPNLNEGPETVIEGFRIPKNIRG